MTYLKGRKNEKQFRLLHPIPMVLKYGKTNMTSHATLTLY